MALTPIFESTIRSEVRLRESECHVVNERKSDSRFALAIQMRVACLPGIYFVDKIQRIPQKPVSPSQVMKMSLSVRQNEPKTSAQTEDKMSSGRLRRSLCIKDEATRMINQEASLPDLKSGLQIEICTPFCRVFV